MSLELKAPPEVEGLPLELPPHLAENFEKADRQLRELYGQSPGVPVLVRLCPDVLDFAVDTLGPISSRGVFHLSGKFKEQTCV